MRLSTTTSEPLRAVAYGLKLLDRDLRSQINRQTVAELGPVWKELVTKHASTSMDARVLVPGTRVKSGNPPILLAAQSRRPIGKTRRLVPNQDWPAWEFGAADVVVTYRRRSPKGVEHTVKRHTRRQLPARDRSGRVVFAALAELGPRAVSLWVQTFMRSVHEAAENKRR